MTPERPGAVDPLSHTLGRIEHSLETITKTLSEDRTASATYRTDMRRDLATLRDSMATDITKIRDDIHDLKSRVINNSDELAEMRPHVESWRLWSAQAQGGWNVAKAFWITATGALGLGGGVLLHALWPKQ